MIQQLNIWQKYLHFWAVVQQLQLWVLVPYGQHKTCLVTHWDSGQVSNPSIPPSVARSIHSFPLPVTLYFIGPSVHSTNPSVIWFVQPPRGPRTLFHCLFLHLSTFSHSLQLSEGVMQFSWLWTDQICSHHGFAIHTGKFTVCFDETLNPWSRSNSSLTFPHHSLLLAQ